MAICERKAGWEPQRDYDRGVTMVAGADGGLVGFPLPQQFHLLIAPLQPPNRHRLYIKDKGLATNPAATQGEAPADPS